MNLSRWAWALLLAVHGGMPAFAASVAGYAEINLVRGYQNHLSVPVTINGKTAFLIVDTGAGLTFVDEGRARRLGLSPHLTQGNVSRMSGRPVPLGLAEVDSFQVGGVPVPIREVGVLSDATVRRQILRTGEAAGQLGALDLARAHAVLSCYHAKLFFPRPGTDGQAAAAELRRAGFVPVPFDLSPHGAVAATVTVNGHGGRALLDSGAPTTVLDEGFCRSAGVGLSGGSTPVTGSLIGETRLSVGQAATFALGPYTRPNVTVATDWFAEKRSQGRGLPADVVGVVGGEFLALNDAYFDFKEETLYLRPVAHAKTQAAR